MSQCNNIKGNNSWSSVGVGNVKSRIWRFHVKTRIDHIAFSDVYFGTITNFYFRNFFWIWQNIALATYVPTKLYVWNLKFCFRKKKLTAMVTKEIFLSGTSISIHQFIFWLLTQLPFCQIICHIALLNEAKSSGVTKALIEEKQIIINAM